MKYLIVILLAFGFFACNNPKNKPTTDGLAAIQQTFVGTSDCFQNCAIRINKDLNVNFIYYGNKFGDYIEHFGTIKPINDTLFLISTTMTFGQSIMKSYGEDSIYIEIDSTITDDLENISLEYSNKTQKHFTDFNKKGKPIQLLTLPIDKTLYNRKTGFDIVKLKIDHKNIITKNKLILEIPIGSAASFFAGDKETFYVVIKNNQLYTTLDPPRNTGHFKLRKLKS